MQPNQSFTEEGQGGGNHGGYGGRCNKQNIYGCQLPHQQGYNGNMHAMNQNPQLHPQYQQPNQVNQPNYSQVSINNPCKLKKYLVTHPKDSLPREPKGAKIIMCETLEGITEQGATTLTPPIIIPQIQDIPITPPQFQDIPQTGQQNSEEKLTRNIPRPLGNRPKHNVASPNTSKQSQETQTSQRQAPTINTTNLRTNDVFGNNLQLPNCKE
jgi:hypothetical protein